MKSRIDQAARGEVKRLSEVLRVHQSLLSQVFSGLRDLNADQVFEVANYWGLTRLEYDYFSNLVEIERAATHDLKNFLKQKSEEIKKQSLDLSKRVSHQTVLNDEQKAIFYSSWIYAAIRAYTSIGNGKTAEEIMTTFRIERPKAISVLQFLTRTGLCVEEKDKYKLGTQSTHLDKNSPHIQKHHMNWRMRAMEKSDYLTDEELMFSAPLSISEKDFLKIREKLVLLIKEASETVKDTEPEIIACLSFDLIKI